MKIGIISDIEGNDKKLELVLSRLTDCNSVVNLGDMIGDKGDSNRVINLLRQEHITSLLGNHDLEVILGKSVPADKVAAKILHGSSQLYHFETDLINRNRKFIRSLDLDYKLDYRGRRYRFCHSFYDTYKNNLYFDNVHEYNALAFVEMTKADVTFIGHKHVAEIIVIDPRTGVRSVTIDKPVSFKLDRKKKCIVNVGSVGAPRNKIANFSYSILDLAKDTIHLIVENPNE